MLRGFKVPYYLNCETKNILDQTFNDWMTEAKQEQQVQIIEVLVIGFRVR